MKKQYVIAFTGLLGILAIILGVTYAFFSYSRGGTKDNTISSGSVKFLYTENSSNGPGISITEAMPMLDSQGKVQTNYFDFKIMAEANSAFKIPYVVTARVSNSSSLPANVVKVWLSDPTTTPETEIETVKYFGLRDAEPSNTVLERYTVGYAANYNERILYSGEVPASQGNLNNRYTKDFRLRIWIDNDTDFTSRETVVEECSVNLEANVILNRENCEAANGEYTETVVLDNPYQNKTFTITVNVYANGEIVSQDITVNAEEVSYANPLSTECVTLENQTIKCALDE